MNIIKNGISVYVEGESEKIPVVFIHGFPFDHNMWHNQVSVFNRDYFCVTYDVRGLGNSDAGDGQFTMEQFVDDLEMVLAEINISKSVLCGLSMGGYIALRAVERMEQKFRGLILCDTKSAPDNDAGKINRALDIKKINVGGSDNYNKDFIYGCFSKSSLVNKINLVDELISRSEYFSATGIKGCLLAMASRTDTTGYLSKLKIPALVLCGEEDSLTTPEIMKEMAAKINNSEFYVVPEAGHLSPVENPEVVNQHINKFLKKIKL